MPWYGEVSDVDEPLGSDLVQSAKWENSYAWSCWNTLLLHVSSAWPEISELVLIFYYCPPSQTIHSSHSIGILLPTSPSIRYMIQAFLDPLSRLPARAPLRKRLAQSPLGPRHQSICPTRGISHLGLRPHLAHLTSRPAILIPCPTCKQRRHNLPTFPTLSTFPESRRPALPLLA